MQIVSFSYRQLTISTISESLFWVKKYNTFYNLYGIKVSNPTEVVQYFYYLEKAFVRKCSVVFFQYDNTLTY